MIIPQYYYLDAATLSSATAVYLDELLTVCAPDGFYSDGVITRELVGCSLLPEQICNSCTIPCPITKANNTSEGIYLFNVNTGTNTGAIVIKVLGITNFNPIGVRGIFQSVTYNKLVSPFDGVHQSSSPFNYTFVGDSSYDCTPPMSGENYLLQNYIYDGTNFVNTSSSQSLTVNPFDVSLSTGNPNYFVMIIPKPSSVVSSLNLYFAVPCDVTETSYTFNIECPTNLTSISASIQYSSSSFACAGSLSETYYYYSLTNSYPNININDYIFTDINGEFPLQDGFYRVDNNGNFEWMQVQDGIVIAMGTCI